MQTLLVDEITSVLVVTDEMFSWAEDSKTNRRPCDPILMSNGLSDWFQWDGKIFYLSTGFNDNNYLIGRYFNLGIPQTLKLVDVIVREQSHGHWKRVKICKIYNYKVHKIKFYRFFIIFITIYQLIERFNNKRAIQQQKLLWWFKKTKEVQCTAKIDLNQNFLGAHRGKFPKLCLIK